jgi:hypothetical protein
VLLVLLGVDGVTRQDEVAETGCKPLDLPLDAVGHVLRRSVRDVAVRPSGVMTGGRARRVEHALLRDEHEGLLSRPPLPDRSLVLGDLLEFPADVHRRRARAFRGLPRDRSGQRPVHFE